MLPNDGAIWDPCFTNSFSLVVIAVLADVVLREVPDPLVLLEALVCRCDLLLSARHRRPDTLCGDNISFRIYIIASQRITYDIYIYIICDPLGGYYSDIHSVDEPDDAVVDLRWR